MTTPILIYHLPLSTISAYQFRERGVPFALSKAKSSTYGFIMRMGAPLPIRLSLRMPSIFFAKLLLNSHGYSPLLRTTSNTLIAVLQ